MTQQLIDMVNALTERLNAIVNNSKNITDLDPAVLPLDPNDEIGFWDISESKMIKTTLSELLQGGSSFADNLFEIFNSATPSKVVQFDVSNVLTTQPTIVTMRNTSGTIAYLSDIPGSDHYRPPLQDLTQLAAILTSNITDKERRYVEDEYSDYFYDADAAAGDVAPVNQVGGIGWWIKAYTGTGNVGDMTELEYAEGPGQVKDSLRLNGELASFYATAQGLIDAQTDIDGNTTVINQNVAAIALKEDDLGIPAANGYVLSSDINGNRSWIPVASGGVVTFVENFIATPGQTLHTVAQGSIADNGQWTVQVNGSLWNSTSGLTGMAGGLITISFATGQITFNSPLQGGAQVIIKHQ